MIPGLAHYKEKWNVVSDRSIKPGLDSIQYALMKLGNPEKKIKVVHFAGTNGKGSTLSFVEQMAREHQLTVGKFMSPCILDIHDQIQINGQYISEQHLDRYFKMIQQAELSGQLTDFELLTCIAFLHFATEKVDLALVEAGMGGREDSTNVVMPIVSVITSIALEHTNFLGNTIESIAGHKAGIIKKNRPVVIGNLPEAALTVMKEEAQKQDAPIFVIQHDFSVTADTNQCETYQNDTRQIKIQSLERALLGDHQRDNMALALTAFIEVAHELNISLEEKALIKAVKQTTVPGRFEEVLPNVYFDGAHNPASAKALGELLESNFANQSIEIMIGMLADKDVEAVLTILEPLAMKMMFLDVPNERALSAEKFYALSKHQNKEVLTNAVAQLKQPIPTNTIRVVTGSLYLLASIRAELKK